VAVYLQPEMSTFPSRRNRPVAANRRVESMAVGPSVAGWNSISGFSHSFTLPDLVLSPDDDDFALGSWLVAIYADTAATVTLSVMKSPVPPTLHVSQDYSLNSLAVATSFEWRVPYHPNAGLTVKMSYEEVSGKTPEECPLSILAQYSLPPSRKSWIAAAGREGAHGRNSMSVPPRADQDVTYLLFSAARCPGGYSANATHCIRLDQCSVGGVEDFSNGGALFGLRDGPCGTATNVTRRQVGEHAAGSLPVLVPPAMQCAFRFRLDTLES